MTLIEFLEKYIFEKEDEEEELYDNARAESPCDKLQG